jgi:phytoene dehydrogenase-like protein
MIVAQATSEKVNFFTAALSLGYTFNETHYPLGGMGAMCETITSKLSTICLECTVQSISSKDGIYHLSTTKGQFRCRNLIMGNALYGTNPTFDDPKIQNYTGKYQRLHNHQSAFVLYMSLKTTRHYEHHYQLIGKEIVPNTLSKSLFVSFSDPSDRQMAPEGEYRVTASIHTDERWWIGLPPSLYKRKKQELQELLQEWILDTLSLDISEVEASFSATPKTFSHYIHRSQLGGNALTLSNPLPFLPSNDTPIEGFYNVGDTTYAAQGWPGVVMGAFNALRMIHGEH